MLVVKWLLNIQIFLLEIECEGRLMPNAAILMLAYTLTSNAMNKVTDFTSHSTNNDYAQALERGQLTAQFVQEIKSWCQDVS